MLTRFYSDLAYSSVPLASATTPMPAGAHIVPGAYLLNGVGYDCSQIGCYQFFDEATGICQNKVCYNTDIRAYLSAWSWLHEDGKREEGLDITALQIRARNRKLHLGCGYITDLMRQLLLQYPYPARAVNLLTGQAPNGWDDGHIVLEEKSTGAWRLFDMTTGCYFTDANGVQLSLKDIINLGMTNCLMIKMSEKSRSSDVGSTGLLDYGICDDFIFTTDAQKKAWCDRIYQIPCIGGQAYIPVGLESRQSWVQNQGYVILNKAAWETLYYQ